MFPDYQPAPPSVFTDKIVKMAIDATPANLSVSDQKAKDDMEAAAAVVED